MGDWVIDRKTVRDWEKNRDTERVREIVKRDRERQGQWKRYNERERGRDRERERERE